VSHATQHRQLHLAVALDGAGWHPAAWRSPDARPAELFTGAYWADLVAEAERGLVDFVTIEDSLTVQSADRFVPDDRTDQVRGRLDAVLIASRVAPTSRYVGVVPTVTTAHTEPFHISKAIATLDYVSTGRAGMQVRVGGLSTEASLFGRREVPEFGSDSLDDRNSLDDPKIRQFIADGFNEAADYVEVVRRLWDSWQDDAVIKDVATGRYIDRDRLHYIDFEGRSFSVRGPSITPRPPQGQPIVAALAHQTVPYRFAARQADVVFVTPRDLEVAAALRSEVHGEAAEANRSDELKVFADLVVFLNERIDIAHERKQLLDELNGKPLRSDARIFVGTAHALADELAELQKAGYDGIRLRPGALPHDLTAITDLLVPELQRRNLFRREYQTDTLRGHLGLHRPANRYEVA
jgi:alkanesulfonate monooxygenase SsuD/methylene tetrahydromethanopterin reductase-like flavin-dependent oxidoreductase (luciferase family)